MLVTIGVIVLVIGLYTIFAHESLTFYVVRYAELYLSKDHNIESEITPRISNYLYYISIFFILIGIILFLSLKETISTHFKIYVKRLSEDPLSKSKNRKIWILIFMFFPSIIGISLYFFFQLREVPLIAPLHGEDNFFENLTFLMLAISSLLMIKAAVVIKHIYKETGAIHFRRILFFYIALAGFFFLCAMEELSWAQRIFGWETPQWIGEINTFERTDIHGMFGLFFRKLEQIFALLLYSMVVVSVILHGINKETKIQNLVLPYWSLIIIGLIMALSIDCELIETLFAFFALFYSLRLAIGNFSTYKKNLQQS